MFQDKYVFAQLASFLNRSKFNRIVTKYDGDKYVKHFTCWNQLLALMFGQLSNRESLRDLIVALEAHHSKCYHLGMGKNVSESSLARANQDRDYHIFEEYAYYLVSEARQKCADHIFRLGGNVYAFDSTTIDLCLSVFGGQNSAKRKVVSKCMHYMVWEHRFLHSFISWNSIVMIEITYEPSSYYIFDRSYNNFKMLYKIHQIEAYFVVRAKKNLQYKSIQWKRKLPRNVLSDASVLLTGFYPKQYYPEPLRLVKYWDEEQEREFTFITNAMHISALQVVGLYKNRWQVELFFKWLKQYLKIKRFWGNYRECCSNTDICCYMRLLFGGNHSTRYATGQKYI